MTRSPTPSSDTSVEDVAAIVLAGGRGERLGPLTRACAKPALPFGSAWKVIDFSLSNCVNSGIGRIGVATQYQACSVAGHIRRAWNLPRRARHGIELWDAATCAPDGCYSGTADAVFRNLENLRVGAPRLLLVLAGDHVYQMDYRPMIETHLRTRAAATIACIEVPLAEASSYGVLGTDASLRIDSFAEKPANPVPTVHAADRALISMGIYLFDFETIARELQADALIEGSSHDFGHDVIPRLIHAHRVQAYRFHDAAGEPRFWRDVGTLDMYYETSMALLDDRSGFDPEGAAWPVYSGGRRAEPVRFRARPACDPGAEQADGHRGAPVTLEGMAIRSDLGAGCQVAGGIVNHSVLAEGVYVDSGALVQSCVVLPEARIGARSTIRNAIVAAGCRVPPGTRIGIDGSEDTLPCERTAGGIRIVTQEAIDRWLGSRPAGTEGVRRRSRLTAVAG